MAQESHVLMKKSLAKALLDAGVQHFDTGGTTQGGIGGLLTPQNQFVATAPTITRQPGLPGQISNLQNQNYGVYNQQQNLAQALLNQSQGVGPNPAQAALNQNTGTNVANTAALMASSRGAGGNPGLVARNAALAGAGTQQNAVEAAATLQAQQELAAQQQEAGVLQNIAANSLQGQSINQGALASENAAETTGQLGTSQVNAQTAAQNATNAAATTGGLIGGLGTAAGLAAAGLGGAGTTGTAGGTPNSFSPVGSTAAPSSGTTSAPPSSFSPEYKGGQIQNFDQGGIANYATPVDPREVLTVVRKNDGSGSGSSAAALALGLYGAGKAIGNGLGSISSTSQTPGTTQGENPTGGNGESTAPVQPNVQAGPSSDGTSSGALPTNYIGSADVNRNGGFAAFGGPIDYRCGGPVAGKAAVAGNSLQNDTVPAMLSPGEDVLPRSVTQAPDAPERAKRFVEALQDKKGKEDGYGKILKARASLKDRVERLEKMCMGGAA